MEVVGDGSVWSPLSSHRLSGGHIQKEGVGLVSIRLCFVMDDGGRGGDR